MTRTPRFTSIALALLSVASAANAQTTPLPAAPEVTITGKVPPPKDKPKPPPQEPVEITSVTVAAERPTGRIDRQVYDVKSDISSTNGTAADALNSVPSVAVDPDGTVSLRGSTNVQILIDGKPSAMLQGDNRGATLNALSAEDIDSIEVINNPGAQFGNEGGGGPILNLVMRRNRRPGGFASVSGNAGTAGRYNSSVSGSYNEGYWGFQGSAHVRHDGRNAHGESERDRIDIRNGAPTHSETQSATAGLNNSAGINGAVSYNHGAHDTFNASLTYNQRDNDQRARDHYLNTGPGQATISDYVRTSLRAGESKNYAWGARWDHKGDVDGETLKVDLRVSSADNTSGSDYTSVYAVTPPGRIDTHSRQRNDTDNHIADFTGDYERPAFGGMLKAGWKVASNRNRFDAFYADILANGAETINPARTNLFEVDEGVTALYGSYQLRLNEQWGALAGLRAEHTSLDLNQVTGGIRAKNNYINYIPSFFATYKVSDDANLRFSYAHRLRRPNAGDLNPFVVYRDEFNVSSGNPHLKPTQTDSFEIGYETRMAGLETALRGYYRKEDDAILERKVFISDTVLLTTRGNGPGSSSGGLEFTVNGKLMPGLSLNTSGNLARSEQRILDSSGAPTGDTRTASSLSGRVRLNYQPTPQDQLQFMVQAQGKTLTGQGFREPNTTANFSLRHSLTPALNLVLNVTDIFNSNKMESVTDTDLLKDHTQRRFDGRIVYIGLSYRIGGAGGGMRSPGGRGPGGPGPGGPGGPM